MSSKSCENCKFSERGEYGRFHSASTALICVRFPPSFVGDDCGMPTSKHPNVSPFSWCGEFQPEYKEIKI